MSCRRSLFLTLLSLLFTAHIVAQNAFQPASLTGNLLEAATKKPLPNATVSLVSRDGKLLLTILSSEKGSFSLLVSDTGAHQVRITHAGLKEQVLRVQITPNFTGWHLGTLNMQPGEGTLAEVVIKTERPLVEQKADRLVYNAERDLSTLGGTAADVLRNVPMLSVDGDGNVQLRGTSNIRVLINNKPSSLIAVSLADALRQLPAENIKSVEVITSPGARYDAEGTAGVINIITKKNLLQGVTGLVSIVPGNVSTIGNAGLNFRRPKYGLNFSSNINQFYNTGTTFLQRKDLATGEVLTQDGKTKNRSGFVSPRLGFDWTLNERTSLSGGVAYTPSHNTVRNQQVITESGNGRADERSSFAFLNSTQNTSFDYNLELLRTFKDPQKELALLMIYGVSNTDNEIEQERFDLASRPFYRQRNTNDSKNEEATMQLDYTHPFKNKTVMEVGAKTIIRKAGSSVLYQDFFLLPGTQTSAVTSFTYTQNVWSGYFSYAFQLGNVQIKPGLRYEGTGIDALDRVKNVGFQTDYQNFIPSFNAAYTFKQKHSLRLSYTQRLQRPQLFFLNPYREVVAPQVIREGNPALDPERSNLYEVGYGTYGPKSSFNASLYGRTTNNAINSLLSLQNDTTYIRFFNLARNQTYGINLSGNYKPNKKISLNANLNVYHASLEAGALANRGWMYNAFTSYSIDLGKGWWHGFNGSFTSRTVTLQGRMAAFYYHNTTLRKDIWKKRGAIGVNLANPFMRGTRFRTNTAGEGFEQVEDNINFTRGIRLTLNYRFGVLQQAKAPRKAKKTINNDDALRGQ